MGHFHALADAVAVAADRLVAVVRVGSDGGVVVRDLANGGLSTISASELRAPPSRKAILARVRALDKRQVAKARLQ